jgi:hypothetical protein
MGKSPLEKLHARAMAQTAAAGLAGPSGLMAAGEPFYLRRMNQLLDEYLEEAVLEQLPIGA